MKRDAAGSRTNALDEYRIVKVYRPDDPEIERYVWPLGKVIFINTGAKPGAKIAMLIK